MTTTSCSGHKCRCLKFQGTQKTKTCKGCHHGRDWHYNLDSEVDDDNKGYDDDDDDDENDDDDDDDDDSNDDNGNGKTTRSSMRTKNKRTVSSLMADLVEGGEYSGADVDAANREAKAGLMRQQVGSMLFGAVAINLS